MSYLHRPKVKREQSYDQEKTGRKALADPLTQQIDNDGNHSEEQMEKGGHGVSKIVGIGNEKPDVSADSFQTDTGEHVWKHKMIVCMQNELTCRIGFILWIEGL